MERFRREKLADFKRIILDYIQMQIEYSKKVCVCVRADGVVLMHFA